MRAAMLFGLCAAALVTAAVALGQPRSAPTTLAVTITDTQLRVVQKPVRIGLVTFKVANKSKTARDFRIAGKKTPKIAPGKAATLRVTFTKTGLVVYSSTGSGRALLSGVFTFVDPCTTPVASTVSLQMREGTIQLSRPSVPCGSVTFAVTNAGTIVHTFQISAANGRGQQLQPGQTANLTVQLTKKGRVFYSCAEPEHDEMYGETGWINVV
jgi:uncharacterized cupredoxin-like copper-binding protein